MSVDESREQWMMIIVGRKEGGCNSYLCPVTSTMVLGREVSPNGSDVVGIVVIFGVSILFPDIRVLISSVCSYSSDVFIKSGILILLILLL